jgi:FkbM family methyltransferase
MKTQVVRMFYSQRTFWKRVLPLHRIARVHLQGFDLMVRLDDWAVGARIFVKRTYEPYVTAVIKQNVRPGMCVVDIGANIGYYTMLTASQVGSAGKVIAFEPSPDNCALLQQSIQVNGFKNIVLMPCAVAERDGTVSFGMDDSNGGIQNEPGENAMSVKAVALDHALAGEERIDLIKMDVEGSEGRALQGMRQLLQKHRPIVICEFSPYALPIVSGVQPEVYMNTWRELGYELSAITRTGWHPRVLNNAEIMQHFTPPSALDHIDLLATPINPTIPQPRTPVL